MYNKTTGQMCKETSTEAGISRVYSPYGHYLLSSPYLVLGILSVTEWGGVVQGDCSRSSGSSEPSLIRIIMGVKVAPFYMKTIKIIDVFILFFWRFAIWASSSLHSWAHLLFFFSLIWQHSKCVDVSLPRCQMCRAHHLCPSENRSKSVKNLHKTTLAIR